MSEIAVNSMSIYLFKVSNWSLFWIGVSTWLTSFIIINQLVLWDPPVNYYSISRRQGSTFNPRLSVSLHQPSGTLCLHLLKVPPPSPHSRHIWKLNCSLLHTTQSNIFFCRRRLRFELSTYGAGYKCYWHLTFDAERLLLLHVSFLAVRRVLWLKIHRTAKVSEWVNRKCPLGTWWYSFQPRPWVPQSMHHQWADTQKTAACIHYGRACCLELPACWDSDCHISDYVFASTLELTFIINILTA